MRGTLCSRLSFCILHQPPHGFVRHRVHRVAFRQRIDCVPGYIRRFFRRFYIEQDRAQQRNQIVAGRQQCLLLFFFGKVGLAETQSFRDRLRQEFQ